MINANLLALTRLATAGRHFAAALAEASPAAARSFKRWANLWRLVLAGRDTPRSRRLLAQEAQRLKAIVETLPDAERYEAAMALHSRTPRVVASSTVLSKLARETSLLLEPGLEKLVSEAARAVHHDIGALLKRSASGATLSAKERKLVERLEALRKVTGAEYDDAIEEITRECVRQLKETPTAPLKRSASKVNTIQGAVAQGAFFRSKPFLRLIAARVRMTRKLVRRLLGVRWTTTVVREGRIFIARKTKGGFTLDEFVDGAIVAHEKIAPSGRLARGFLDFSAQIKAELDISALSQNLRDEIRRTPGWGTEDAILLIPTARGYRALQLVPPPATLVPQRVLMAAPGGKWPALLPQPASVYNTFKAEGDLSRDTCRALAQFLLSKVRAALK